MENLRKRSNARLVNNEKDCLKCTSNPTYMLHIIFDNNLVAVRKRKVSLKLNKPAHIGMCILELSNVLMYEFRYDYMKNKYDKKSALLFADTDSLMCVKLKLKMSTKILTAIKKCLILVIIRQSQNNMMTQTN